MNLNEFISRDIGEFLLRFRPLAGFEQLHIIYHSKRPLREKRAAYEALLKEFSGDPALAEHLRRNIRKIDHALDAPNREANPEHMFIAYTDVYELNEQGAIKYGSDVNRLYSTYTNAIAWLDQKRKSTRGPIFRSWKECKALLNGGDSNGQAERQEAEKDVPLLIRQRITELALDTNDKVNQWQLDERGEVCAFLDPDMEGEMDVSKPECRYIHLPGLYAPGDILTLRKSDRWRYYPGVAVALHGYAPSEQGADYRDEMVDVLLYDPKNNNTRLDRWPIWATQRTDKVLNRQKALRKISRQCKEGRWTT